MGEKSGTRISRWQKKPLDFAGEIVDFDAGHGEAATVEMDDYTKSLAQAKVSQAGGRDHGRRTEEEGCHPF
jgi:hypothetical protein